MRSDLSTSKEAWDAGGQDSTNNRDGQVGSGGGPQGGVEYGGGSMGPQVDLGQIFGRGGHNGGAGAVRIIWGACFLVECLFPCWVLVSLLGACFLVECLFPCRLLVSLLSACFLVECVFPC